MPELRPLAGLRYDPRAVPDLATVLCPPYDVISDAERARLAALDGRNAVHLELPAAGDAADDSDRYAAAARRLAEWRAGHVLQRDQPMVYVYEQSYSAGAAGEPSRLARGVYCALRLEEPGEGVRRHERTMAAPKEDRLRLLRAVRANLSPVLLLYADGARGGRSAGLIDRLADREPVVDATTLGTRHRLWAVSGDDEHASALLELAAAKPLTIADGHHRYETALRYRDEPDAPPGAEWAMVLLYDAASGGLTLLPTHRLVHASGETESLLAALGELFTMRSVADATRVKQAVAEAGPGTLGFWTRHGGALLRPRDASLEPLLPAGSPALRELDVTLLGAALERMLGSDAATLADAGRLSYTKDADDALLQVDAGRADACFLLAPTPIEAVMAVAGAGELMPPKSTYFVPKAATGLVFNPLEEE